MSDDKPPQPPSLGLAATAVSGTQDAGSLDTMAASDASLDTLAASGAAASDAPTSPGRGGLRPVGVAASADYQIERQIGHGGMGRVLLAVDRRFNRKVAIKEMLPEAAGDLGLRGRFLEEAIVTGSLEHRGIVPVYDVGTRPDGTPYYAMRLVEGRTIGQVLRGTATLEERLALLPRLTDVADALAYAHRHGVIHRDIKPDNVILGDHGDTYLLDWGVARVRGREDLRATELHDRVAELREEGGHGTRAGQIVGTPAYMSPEQIAGSVDLDERSDVYAMGALLYEVCAGVSAYGGTSARSVLASVTAGPPPSVLDLEPRVPVELAAIVAKAMARAPEERYASAVELADDLRRLVAGQLVLAHRYGLGQRAGRLLRRQWRAAAVMLLLAAGGATVAAWQLGRLVVQRDDARAAAAVAERARVDALDEVALISARLALPTDRAAALGHLAAVSDQAPTGEVWLTAVDAINGGVKLDLVVGQTVDQLAWGKTWLAMAVGGKVQSPADGTDAAAAVVAPQWKVQLHRRDGESREIEAPCDGKIVDLALLADGRVVWACGAELLRCDAEGKVCERTRLPDAIERASLSDGGERYAAALASGNIAIGAWGGPPSLQRVGGGLVHDLEVSPDGQLVVVAAGSTRPTLLEAQSGRQRKPTNQQELPTLELTRALFSPDGQHVALLGRDRRVALLAAATGAGRLLAGRGDWLADAVFTPDNRRLAVGGSDGTLQIFELDPSAAGAAPILATGHRAPLRHLAATAGVLASSDDTGEVRLWVPTTGHGRLIERAAVAAPVALAPDGLRLAFAIPGGGVRLIPLPPTERAALRTFLRQFSSHE